MQRREPALKMGLTSLLYSFTNLPFSCRWLDARAGHSTQKNIYAQGILSVGIIFSDALNSSANELFFKSIKIVVRI
jgi:hypothetical protein